MLINETEVINNCKASVGILSDETIVKMHPWVSDPEQELKRIKDERRRLWQTPTAPLLSKTATLSNPAQ